MLLLERLSRGRLRSNDFHRENYFGYYFLLENAYLFDSEIFFLFFCEKAMRCMNTGMVLLTNGQMMEKYGSSDISSDTAVV